MHPVMFALSVAITSAAHPQLGATDDGVRSSSRSRLDTCEAVVSERGRGDIELRNLAGEFNVVLRVTKNARRDSVVRGRMTLERWSPGVSGLEASPVSWEVWGWTTLSIEQIGDIPVGPAPSSADPARPGILGVWDDGGRKMRLDLGTYLPRGEAYLHSGLTLEVQAANSSGFRGRWGGPTYPHATPSGHFCASRLDSVALKP